MRPDRLHLLPELLLIGVPIVVGMAAAIVASLPFLPASPTSPYASTGEFLMVSVIFLGPLVGVVALPISGLWDAGRWWVQVILMGVGVAVISGARWWFWVTRDQPIIFHPGFLPLILGMALIFSGGVSLIWGVLRRGEVTRPGPAARFRTIGALLRAFWGPLVIIVILIIVWVVVDRWMEERNRPDPVLVNINGRERVSTELTHFYPGEWETWEIRCPGEDPRLAEGEMGIILSGVGVEKELRTYPLERLDGCTHPVDRGPHPADREMLTQGVAPAVVVDRHVYSPGVGGQP